jgi:hypothetical protein
MGGFSFGIPEAAIIFTLALFGIVPWIAGIWALITLSRIKAKVESIERLLAGNR